MNGPVEVISGDRRMAIPGFSTGVPTARPAAFVLPGNPSAVRLDPTTGGLLDVTRLVVTASPTTRRQDVDAIAARLAELGECPLCGSGLDPEKFLKKAGGHGTS